MVRLYPGASFAGYRIDDELGRGGMGVVYKATEFRPRRTIALKVVAPEQASDPVFRERFLRESQLAAEIEHPHVVPVLRVGEEEGSLFIAMRFIPGPDLATLIESERRLEPLRAARIVDQVGYALDAAHERGLVHRDVKPGNILVVRDRRGEHAYLTDFGLTKFAAGSKLTVTGMMVGTPDYTPPEQFEGGSVDARADVYALGCVLFKALTGRAPYKGETLEAKMFAHVTAQPPSVVALEPSVPRQFDDVVSRALAKRPDNRYLSAGDLGRAALAAADGRSLTSVERSVAIGEAALGSASAVTSLPAVEAEVEPELSDGSRIRPGSTVPRENAAVAASTGTKPARAELAATELESTERRKAAPTLPSPLFPRRPSRKNKGGRERKDQVGGAETVDRVARRRRGRALRGGAAAVAAAGVLGAAALGFVLAPASGGSGAPATPQVRSGSAGPLAVSFPVDWQRRSMTATPALALTNEIALAPRKAGGAFVIGTAKTTGANPLPRSFLAVLSNGTMPQVVTLGHAQFYRYLDVLPRGSSTRESVYAVPTTAGTVIGVCLLHGAGPNLPSDCERILGTLRLSRGTALDLAPSSSVRAALTAVIRKLTAAIGSGVPRLRAAQKAAQQASAAGQLSAAYDRAASALAKLQAGRAGAAVVALESALGKIGDNYAALRHAALANDPGAYNSARIAIASDANVVSAAAAELAKFGYPAATD